MISIGGGIALLVTAVCALVLSESPWIRFASLLVLGAYGASIVFEVVVRDGDPLLLVIPILLLLLGIHAHGVQRRWDK